ncbi:MAG: hypothetical protein V1656_03280 [Candidatus Jorgensenbacteria bacterium]
MSRKQIVILAVSGAFVVLMVFFGFLNRQYDITGAGETPALNGQNSEAGQGAAGTPKNFSPDVPKGAVETKPKSETPMVGQEGENQGRLGTYEVTASPGGYAPSSLTIRQGDIVELTFFSTGGDFDFFIPALSVHLSAPSGGKMTASFRSTASGTFLFECRDACPAGKTISGQLIVLPVSSE